MVRKSAEFIEAALAWSQERRVPVSFSHDGYGWIVSAQITHAGGSYVATLPEMPRRKSESMDAYAARVAKAMGDACATAHRGFWLGAKAVRPTTGLLPASRPTTGLLPI